MVAVPMLVLRTSLGFITGGAIFVAMPLHRTLVCAVALLCAAPAAAAAARTPWATVNVCDTASNPDTIGIRGSMPAMTTAHPPASELFMRFQLQYERSDGTWRFLSSGGDSGFIDAGKARGRTPRQAGHSFTVSPPKAGNVYTLRGLVTFEWRAKDGTVVRRARKRTTAGHRSTAGADPAGFSAAECTITA
jgi:hypothetical protein